VRAAAAPQVESAAPARQPRPGLFSRVTGGGLLRKEPEPRTVAADPEPRREPIGQVRAAPPPAPEQPRLEGVDRGDRRPPAQAEEDLLDIPAFLRRQAN
jgi:cell division protein FtsZ